MGYREKRRNKFSRLPLLDKALFLLAVTAISLMAYGFIMLYLEEGTIDPRPRKTNVSTTVETTQAVEATSTVLDDFARLLYLEEVDSQAAIEMLVDEKMTDLQIGRCELRENYAYIPITVSIKGNITKSGTIIMQSHEGVWYFQSVTDDSRSPVSHDGEEVPEESMVLARTLVTEQAKSQPFIESIISGGIKHFKVSSHNNGANTKTISGVVDGNKAASLVFITDNSEEWFLASMILR